MDTDYSATRPQIALVICTRDRANRLGPFLTALGALDTPRDTQLVIVDNASVDTTAEVLDSFAAPPGVELTVLKEPRRGLGRARNTGWRATRASIVAFTDDDCYVSASLLQDYLRAFQQHRTAGCIGGRVRLHDPTDLRLTILERDEERVIEPGRFVPAGFIHGANFAFRREVLTQLGGFDEHLGAGTRFRSGEDVDMVANAVAAGWSAVYAPQPTVSHHHGRKTAADAAALSSGHDLGRGAYTAKYVLDRRVSFTYLRAWLRRMRRQPWPRTARELRGGLAYAWAAATKRWPEPS